jgi:hypothetical protein
MLGRLCAQLYLCTPHLMALLLPLLLLLQTICSE